MPTPHVPSCPGGNDDGDAVDVSTDDGLRHVLGRHSGSAWWDNRLGTAVLTEIRRRAVRNAAHIAATTDTVANRDLVDDVVAAAWIVLREHGGKVASAARPWAYLMSSAQKQALAEVRAQQLLTKTASIRGRAREVLPQVVRPIGSTPVELAVAFRHEPSGDPGDTGSTGVLYQVRRHERTPLQAACSPPATHRRQRTSWFVTFIDLLVRHGADRDATIAAVERLADLLSATAAGRWEWAARRDPVLARLGLSPDQCGALVALVAGSRSRRHSSHSDGLLPRPRAARAHAAKEHLSPLQQRRIARYVRAPDAEAVTVSGPSDTNSTCSRAETSTPSSMALSKMGDCQLTRSSTQSYD